MGYRDERGRGEDEIHGGFGERSADWEFQEGGNVGFRMLGGHFHLEE